MVNISINNQQVHNFMKVKLLGAKKKEEETKKHLPKDSTHSEEPHFYINTPKAESMVEKTVKEPASEKKEAKKSFVRDSSKKAKKRIISTTRPVHLGLQKDDEYRHSSVIEDHDSQKQMARNNSRGLSASDVSKRMEERKEKSLSTKHNYTTRRSQKNIEVDSINKEDGFVSLAQMLP